MAKVFCAKSRSFLIEAKPLAIVCGHFTAPGHNLRAVGTVGTGSEALEDLCYAARMEWGMLLLRLREVVHVADATQHMGRGSGTCNTPPCSQPSQHGMCEKRE